MAHYDIFRGQLANTYPAYGHALWDPSPATFHSPVEVGDVGFIREGRFHRLFNALLPADHPSHELGVPEYHVPLIPKLAKHIHYSTLSRGHYHSAGIEVATAEPDVRALGPDDDFPRAEFVCRGKRGGAVLSIPVQAQRQDTLALEAFGKWMVKHIDRWFAFARHLELGIKQMEEIILVTGCDRTRSWTNVAFLGSQADSQASFGVHVHGVEGSGIDWQFSPEQIRGAVLNQGPCGKNLPENQSVFLRGFRVARTLRILPKHLKAAAEPPSDADGDDDEPDMELVLIPNVKKYQDPLYVLLEYVAEQAPECDMVLVHDDDLAQISEMICDNNSTDTLQADVVKSYLEKSHAEVHAESYDISPGKNDSPQTIRVGTLLIKSPELNPTPQPSLESLQLVNMGPHYTSQTPSLPDTRAFFLRLPPEVISRILISLSPRDIISCRRTCRTLYYLCNDPLLRYLVQMERSAVNDEIRPGLSYPERLRILEKREEAWATLDFGRTVHVTVPFNSTGTYDFTSGTLFLGTNSYRSDRQLTFGYSYFPLPSLSDVQDQKLDWKEFSLGIQIMDVGLAVHEHDLLAALTATADEDGSSDEDKDMTLEIRLLEFSTGRPHSLAEEPIIFIIRKNMRLGPCDVLIEIVGDFLALLITFPWSRSENEDEFFLVRWKKGETHRFSTWRTSPCFSFLSQDTLVFPNLIQNTLELVKIVIDSDDDDAPRLVPLCMLNLPPLTGRASIVRLSCRAEPNPIGSGALAMPAPSRRPFRDKAEDAIMLFSILIENVPPSGEQSHFPLSHPFTFIVHRRALAAHIPAEHWGCAPYCCPSIVPARLGELVQVPWDAWGVAATRWFEGGYAWMRWITTTAGQRAVTMEDDAPTPIIVQDFNPYAVNAARARAAAAATAAAGSAAQSSSREKSWAQEGRNWSEKLLNGNRMTLKVEESVLPAGNMFREDLRSALPYVEVVTRKKYRYEGVLIDEERILGLQTTQDEVGISSFDVLILG